MCYLYANSKCFWLSHVEKLSVIISQYTIQLPDIEHIIFPKSSIVRRRTVMTCEITADQMLPLVVKPFLPHCRLPPTMSYFDYTFHFEVLDTASWKRRNKSAANIDKCFRCQLCDYSKQRRDMRTCFFLLRDVFVSLRTVILAHILSFCFSFRGLVRQWCKHDNTKIRSNLLRQIFQLNIANAASIYSVNAVEWCAFLNFATLTRTVVYFSTPSRLELKCALVWN